MFFLIASPAKAQQTMSAIPTRLDLKADPGQTISTGDALKIRNDTSASQLYSIFIDDFIVTDTLGTPIPVSANLGNRWSLKSWVSAPQIIPVDAHGTQIVRLSIKVPLTALPGGHFAMITYQPNPDQRKGDQKQTSNLIGQRVGTLIYLTVNGPVTQKANITKFTTDKFNEQGPIKFSGSVQNLSDIHINAKGTISIYNPVNNLVAELPVETGNIFPEANRDFSSLWNKKWGYGRYRADLNLVYGTAGGLLNASIFFWLFPIRLVIYSLVALISILIIITILNKRGKRHQEELEKEVTQLKKELNELEHQV